MGVPYYICIECKGLLGLIGKKFSKITKLLDQDRMDWCEYEIGGCLCERGTGVDEYRGSGQWSRGGQTFVTSWASVSFGVGVKIFSRSSTESDWV